MEITLERILTLIPQKADGKFVHGAKKEFAESIGLKSGNLISDWIAGKSASYNSYVYQIADIYNVSVEWLKGESDIKEKAAPVSESGLDADEMQLLELFVNAPEWKKKAALALLKAADDVK